MIAPWNVASYPQGGGHWWVPMQYVLGLRDLGIAVWWFEQYTPKPDPAFDRPTVEEFRRRMEALGLAERAVLWRPDGELLVGSPAMVERLQAGADLLLNFDYELPADVVGRFRQSALVDIDPGLFQHWVAEGQLTPAYHDHWVTVGETVGTSRARFSDLGHEWIRIRPPVHLPSWPLVEVHPDARFTTISGWWGGEWISGADGTLYDNNKRAAFLKYLELPSAVSQELELALNLDLETEGDRGEQRLLRSNGWRVRHSYDVAGNPMAYRRYVQSSAGEFSAVKPSCRQLANAWISDRTVCYLASGHPAVVEHTGPSSLLPDNEGLFRFRDLDEAVTAFAEIERNPEHHRRAARRLAETQFDASIVLAELLDSLGI